MSGVRITEAWHRASSTIGQHAHERATVTLLLDGSYDESFSGGRAIACEAPAVHFRPPGEPHLDRLGRAGAHNLVLELDEARLGSVRRLSALFDDVRQLRDAELLGIVRRLRRELLIDDDATALALEGLALELLAAAARGTRRTTSPRAPWLGRVRDRLRDQFREPRLHLDELAVVAGVHPVHLARAFRAAYGASPGEYLRQQRVAWAATQLQATGRPIADIATEAGFTDQSHLSRAFRAAYGVTPGAWRRARKT